MVVRDYSKPQIWPIDHGFRRLGKMSTPFTLLGGDERPEAEEIHSSRPKSEQQADEDSNEPVTTELAEWEADFEELDYPGVDTIPHEKLLKRAREALASAERLNFVNTVEMPADIIDPECKGEFKKVPKKVRVDTDSEDFLGYKQGPGIGTRDGPRIRCGRRQRRRPCRVRRTGARDI